MTTTDQVVGVKTGVGAVGGDDGPVGEVDGANGEIKEAGGEAGDAGESERADQEYESGGVGLSAGSTRGSGEDGSGDFSQSGGADCFDDADSSGSAYGSGSADGSGCACGSGSAYSSGGAGDSGGTGGSDGFGSSGDLNQSRKSGGPEEAEGFVPLGWSGSAPESGAEDGERGRSQAGGN